MGLGSQNEIVKLVFILEKGFNSQRNTKTEVFAGEFCLGVAHLLAITTAGGKSILEI